MTTALPRALFILRWSIVLFMLPWVIEKFTQPDVTAKIFAAFYGVDNLPATGSYILGALWLALLAAFALGFRKFWSYGLVMLLHGIGTVTTWSRLLPWLDTHNHLFLAAIPTLGAMAALWILRDHDDIGTIKQAGGKKAAAGHTSRVG